jgi:indolepyruvate ferredoxin oxidoreductase alpha subunit
MAERFFKTEVQKLYFGEGQEFRGEGILAVTKALPAEIKLSTGGMP